ncbi:MAG: type II toxin-antitoxin system RelE/ParE family toxin [Pseudomonadota bacterium]
MDEHNPTAAAHLMAQFETAIQALDQMPYGFAVVHDLQGNDRTRSLARNVIFYRVDADVVTIVRALHGASDGAAYGSRDLGRVLAGPDANDEPPSA